MDCEEVENEVEKISSSSLIKFEVFNNVHKFVTLKASVDLRRPPSNWLNGQIKLTSTSSKFTSFVMALDFWRELGDVDVISDSENIKNLLKIPYSDNTISYFVHRVGNTLLIDNFDLPKYLLWKSEEDWQWLRKFIYNHVLSQLNEKDRKLMPIQNKTREFVEQKNLLSKFLYYSLEGSQRNEKQEYVPMQLSQPLLPLPSREEIFDNSRHQFSRNVLWTFEDIRMLIGSDMQIFGNQSRPCISLRLRDSKKPINVLTGIDYWLDNLMCNVPEIFLCFHQNGIVQKYEHIKTEDLPNLENSKFSPKVIRNVAHNILSFLKSNATKAGHTYWLFKAKNDDVVKLYDLTTLQLLASTKYDENCETDNTEKKENDQNPFTIPVAMLLYTVARNMKYSNEKLTAKQAANIKQLLENCLKLLPKDKYPQIVISSHYILADIQIQAGTDPANPHTAFAEDENEVDSDEFYESFSDDDSFVRDGEDCYATAVQNICDSINDPEGEKPKNSRPPPLVLGKIKERCEDALQNVISGIKCLQFCESESLLMQEKQKEKEKIIQEEQNPKLANPDVPIPMGWRQSDLQDGGKKSKKKKNETVEAQNEFQLDSKSLLMKGAPNVKTWNIHLKVLLFEKASLIYACLAEDAYSEKKFGKSLKYLELSIFCQNLVTKYVPGMESQKNCLYGRAGDCYLQISKEIAKLENPEEYSDEYKSESDSDKEMLKELNKEGLLKNGLTEPTVDEGEMLEQGTNCYELGLEGCELKFEPVRRLGNACNELGVYEMKIAHEKFNVSDKTYSEHAKKSLFYLQKGASLFKTVKDSLNIVIVNLNLGRLYRLLAQFDISIRLEGPNTSQPPAWKKYYESSFASYQQSLAVLGSRKANPDAWDHVSWELSTSTFSMAKTVQDCTKSKRQFVKMEKDVAELLLKALKNCDLETNSSRQVLYCFRAGLIHRRLGSLYHYLLRSGVEDSKKRTYVQLSKINYEKAANMLESLKEYKDFFKTQMERIALQELIAEEATQIPLKIKAYQQALSHFQDSYKLLKNLKEAKNITEAESVLKLLELFESRLQLNLKSLTKLGMNFYKKNDAKLAENFKNMFACTLRVPQKMELQELVVYLLSVLEKIKRIESP